MNAATSTRIEDESEKALASSELRYRRLFESAKDGILIFDAETGMVVDVNPYLVNMLGFSHEQFVGKAIWELGFLKDVFANREKFLELQRLEYVRYDDLPLETSDGQRREVEFISNVYLADDKKVIQCNIRDITVRKRAEDLQHASERLAQATLNALSAHLCVLDGDGNIIAVNRAWRNFADSNPPLSSNLNEGANYLSVCDNATGSCSREAAKVAAGIRAVLDGTRREFMLEYPCHSPDEKRWFICRVSRFIGSDTTRLVVAHENITERVLAEKELVLFRALIDQSTDRFEVIDPETFRFLDVNESSCRELGYSRDELLSLRIFDIDSGLDKSTFGNNVEALRHAGSATLKGMHRRKNGTLFPVEVSMKYVTLDRPYVIAVVRNISEQQHAAELQARLAMAVEQAAETIIITDLAGTIVYVNPAFEKVSGYTRAEAIGQNPRILGSGQADEEFYRIMWKALGCGEVWHGHFTNKRKDGSIYKEEASIAPVRDTEGRVINYVATKRDVTHEALLENQLHQAQKMEAVGRLAGGVAHDFNNLLTGIMGYAELCADEVGKDHPIREWLDEITKEAKRSADITAQLLAFARKQTIAPKVLDLNDSVAAMLKLMRRLIGEDINLSWKPGAVLWPVKLDPSQVDQILANLCVNARDAMTGVGTITLSTENITLSADYCDDRMEALPGDYVVLVVTDDGCGMNKETLARIFEPFFSTKVVGKGTGLGLATVYGIVKQNNGFINVYSEPDKGTTFRVYLPRTVDEMVTTSKTESAPIPLGQSETILLVEDERSLRTICFIFLKDLGYNVLVAEDPATALNILKDQPGEIHLLLTDVVMPGMDGRQLAQKVRSLCPDISVLFISGYSADVMAQRGVLEKDVEFLSKPFSRTDLAIKVRQVLDGSSRRSGSRLKRL